MNGFTVPQQDAPMSKCFAANFTVKLPRDAALHFQVLPNAGNVLVVLAATLQAMPTTIGFTEFKGFWWRELLEFLNETNNVPF